MAKSEHLRFRRSESNAVCISTWRYNRFCPGTSSAIADRVSVASSSQMRSQKRRSLPASGPPFARSALSTSIHTRSNTRSNTNLGDRTTRLRPNLMIG